MAKLLGPIGQLIHSTASALIDNQVAARLASAANTLIATGFKAVEDVLKVAQDLTAPEPAQPQQPPQPEEGTQP